MIATALLPYVDRANRRVLMLPGHRHFPRSYSQPPPPRVRVDIESELHPETMDPAASTQEGRS